MRTRRSTDPLPGTVTAPFFTSVMARSITAMAVFFSFFFFFCQVLRSLEVRAECDFYYFWMLPVVLKFSSWGVCVYASRRARIPNIVIVMKFRHVRRQINKSGQGFKLRLILAQIPQHTELSLCTTGKSSSVVIYLVSSFYRMPYVYI